MVAVGVLPPHYGPWKSVYTRYSRWTKQGVWQAALDEVAKEFNDDAWMIDATVIRAHQDSAGVKGGAPKPSVLHAVVQLPRFTQWSTPTVPRSRSRSPKATGTTCRWPNRCSKAPKTPS